MGHGNAMAIGRVIKVMASAESLKDTDRFPKDKEKQTKQNKITDSQKKNKGGNIIVIGM